MKKSVALLFLSLSINFIHAQNAKFYADTVLLRSYVGSQKEFDRAMEMRWLIKGQPLLFGSDTVEVIPDKTKLDTIFYKWNAKRDWDTIICNIAEPHTYNFTFNTCCGGFDVQRNKKRIPMKVEVAIKGVSNKMYLARLGETGKVINGSGKQIITPLCRSAMKPNIFWVMLQQVKVCTDTGNCEKNEEFCIQKENGERDYSFSYTVQKTITKFLYMPLTDKPLRVSYKPERNKLKIK